MAVQRIDNPKKHTHGWQARVPSGNKRRATRFFADLAHGGTNWAEWLALHAERRLWREAGKAGPQEE